MKRLYAKELPDSIRVRALVGLCKMGAQSGGNTKVRTEKHHTVAELRENSSQCMKCVAV